MWRTILHKPEVRSVHIRALASCRSLKIYVLKMSLYCNSGSVFGFGGCQFGSYWGAARLHDGEKPGRKDMVSRGVGMEFAWDPPKDATNPGKHGVGFREAVTIFSDPLATTFPDIDHSVSEQGFLTIGASASGRLLVAAHRDSQEMIRIISARPVTRRERRFSEEAYGASKYDMRPGYNFASMKGGIRGKHYEEYRKGANIVLLKPDVAEAFPTEDAVNEALRGIP